MQKNTACCLIGYLALVTSNAYADTLEVTVSGIKVGQGNLRVAVFDEAHQDQFAEGEYLYGVEVPATAEIMTVQIPDIEPTEYAVAVIQDLNKNGKLDRNFLTIPKEPYGFSGAWKSGAATFEEALIDIRGDGFAITIELK
jgi:uncharacterized protein (DUF2141 family)